ncbi:collagen alpha-1(I) chain-like isoform X1 [Canis lupus familiaris]|uniref:collagen alpha-1(I) chain-like isoform X1 n=1 Tax=Canis lupus familiaris TaxID=9615 RepID=UPI0018F279B4|nr:collagen alpha-1(I) chain-like isoform X1 [Canis lupus familiaris]XP_038406113.1 collagen alpha-1(I) chain-like isoform X1 [Canis lupus familiaris]
MDGRCHFAGASETLLMLPPQQADCRPRDPACSTARRAGWVSWALAPLPEASSRRVPSQEAGWTEGPRRGRPGNLPGGHPGGGSVPAPERESGPPGTRQGPAGEAGVPGALAGSTRGGGGSGRRVTGLCGGAATASCPALPGAQGPSLATTEPALGPRPPGDVPAPRGSPHGVPGPVPQRHLLAAPPPGPGCPRRCPGRSGGCRAWAGVPLSHPNPSRAKAPGGAPTVWQSAPGPPTCARGPPTPWSRGPRPCPEPHTWVASCCWGQVRPPAHVAPRSSRYSHSRPCLGRGHAPVCRGGGSRPRGRGRGRELTTRGPGRMEREEGRSQPPHTPLPPAGWCRGPEDRPPWWVLGAGSACCSAALGGPEWGFQSRTWWG